MEADPELVCQQGWTRLPLSVDICRMPARGRRPGQAGVGRAQRARRGVAACLPLLLGCWLSAAVRAAGVEAAPPFRRSGDVGVTHCAMQVPLHRVHIVYHMYRVHQVYCRVYCVYCHCLGTLLYLSLRSRGNRLATITALTPPSPIGGE